MLSYESLISNGGAWRDHNGGFERGYPTRPTVSAAAKPMTCQLKEITKMRRLQKGFTLFELLLAIGIIAMLAAILLPVFSEVRNASNRKASDGNMQKIGKGILQYMEDNDDKFPRTGYDCRSHLDSVPGDTAIFGAGEANQCGGDGWQDVIGPYVKDPAAFVTENDKSAVGEGPWGGGAGTTGTNTDGNFSFLMNMTLAHKMPDRRDGYADPSKMNPISDGLRKSDVKTAAECVLITEGHGGWDKASAPDAHPVLTDWTGSTDIQNKWHHENTLLNDDFFVTSTAYDGMKFVRQGLPFDNKGGNVLFVDGHQKYVRFQTDAGLPQLCKTLPWTKHMDPQQRKANLNSCKDTDNPLPGNWTNPNWF
jgi:prepilin-type N-terminal cleavage/methylation domain-containing protein/prepilin-type processing-associated H-X9-DG protein